MRTLGPQPQVQVETPLLAMTEDVFQGVATPIRLNRSVSLVGSPMLPEWPMVLLFARHKVGIDDAMGCSLVRRWLAVGLEAYAVMTELGWAWSWG